MESGNRIAEMETETGWSHVEYFWGQSRNVV